MPPRAQNPVRSAYPCADIDNERWFRMAPDLRKFATARMSKSLGQADHLGDDHLQQQGGICAGVADVWCRLHHDQPKAPASTRMHTLMSEAGIVHATIAQRLNALAYKEMTHHDAARPFGMKLVPLQNPRDLSPKLTPEILLAHKGYVRVGLRLLKRGNLFDTGHALALFNPGKNALLTICDANLGEFRVPPKELPAFLAALDKAYQTAPPPVGDVPYTLVRFVGQSVVMHGTIADTPLAGLAGFHRH